MSLFKATLLTLMLVLSACTTMQEVREAEGSLADHLEIGDHIIVYTSTGTIIDMRFVLIDNGVMRGSLYADGLEPIMVRLDEIRKIEAERIAAGRTTAAVLGGIVLAPFASIGAGIAIAEY